MRNNLEIKMLPMLKENQKQEVDEKLRVFENYLKMIEEPDMYFLEKINELEKELEKDKLFLNAFLDMFEKYFNNYEEQFTLVLKHILKKSLALEIEGKLFQLVLNDNSFKQKYGNVSLEIVNDIIVDEDTISSFEAILSLKSH